MRHHLSSPHFFYFIGIGGIGMSGIAEVLHNLGYCVKGSDSNINSHTVQRLKSFGIEIFEGHTPEQVDGAAVIVISSAIKNDHVELVHARALHIPIIQRAEMLAELMRLKKSIAISGTHGKTTTTSLISSLLDHADLDPTIINGGIINSLGTNARLGKGEWIVVEADESDGSFNKLPSTIVVVTNMNADHMDFYRDFNHVRESFHQFIKNVPFYGVGIVCIDHPEVRLLAESITERRIITYGFSEDAQIKALNLRSTPEGITFDVALSFPLNNRHNVTTLPSLLVDLFLPMRGDHNVQNALSVVACALELNLSEDALYQSLASFKGVKRRFTHVGTGGDVIVIDDYAHHPVEIKAVLKAARQTHPGRIIAVFQPHRYSRAHTLKDEFAHSFNDTDIVVVCPIYGAGEAVNPEIHHHQLADKIKESSCNETHIVDGWDDLKTKLQSLIQSGDMVICLGAGNITDFAQSLPLFFEEAILTQKAS
jgi:UDP-N-acetylmuramate--alanine ligase